MASTYRADIGVAAGGAGIAVEIRGSDNRIVKLKQLFFSKPSAQLTLRLIKQSGPSTGGTSTFADAIPLDSDNDPAGARVALYTAAPTAGTALGDIFEGVIATTDVLMEEFFAPGSQPVTLRGASQSVGLRVSAAATLVGYIEWTEE